MTRSAAPPTTVAEAAPNRADTTPNRADTAPDHHQGALTHRQILTIISGLMLGMFLAALDQTIVSTAIRTIADNLHGLSLQAWGTTAYLITSTIATPLYGKLSDLYGRKPFFLTAITIFLVGSVACTFSQSMYELAAFRAVQGLGAGGLMSLALAILGDIVSPRQRAKYTGYFMSVFGISSVVGPVIGGFLAGQPEILHLTGWRWVFLVNVPIGAIALVVVAKVLNIPHTRREHRIDWFGAITISIALVPLLIVAEQGRDWGWKSPSAWICYGIGMFGVLMFLLVEYLMKDEALIPLRLFRNSIFSVGAVGNFLVGMAMFGGIALIPQYLQIVQGASPTKAGLLMLPFVFGMLCGAVLSGQITSRTGHYKTFPIVGTALLATGGLLFHFRVDADTALWQTDLYMVLLGFGLGNCMQTLTIAVQNAVSSRDMGVATASTTFSRQMGGTMGTAVFLSVLFSTVADRIRDAFQSIAPTVPFQAALHDPAVLTNPNNRPVLEMIRQAATGGSGNAGGALQDSSFIQRLDPRLARPFLVGFASSMQTVFLCVAGIAALALLVLLFLKQIPLRTQSGLQARASEADTESLPGVPAVTELAQGNGHPVTNGHGGRHRGGTAAALPTVQTSNGNGTRPGRAVRGFLRRADGTPVGHAALTLIDLAGDQIGRVRTQPDGSYEIDTPGSGTYVLIASATSHRPRASTVVVGDGPEDFDVVLRGNSELTGVVRAAGQPSPIEGAIVTLADGHGEVVGKRVTVEDGSYRFSDTVSGSYTLAASASGFRPAACTVLIPESGETREDIELFGTSGVQGFALATVDNRPVTDARVTLLDPQGTPVAATITDHQGGYAIHDVPEGEYTIVATGYPPVTASVRLVDGERVQHDVRLGHKSE